MGWPFPGEIEWTERRWRTLGTQRLPQKIRFRTADEVVACVGDLAAWNTAKGRMAQILDRWPSIIHAAASRITQLESYSAADFDRLISLVSWLESNPVSGYYPRQIPIAGMDSKWFESHRGIVCDILGAVLGCERPEESLGLKSLPQTVRFRILDRELQNEFGGLTDLTVDTEELARRPLPVSTIFIVENVQTALAFQPMPSTIVFMGLGYRVDALSRIPWIQDKRCFYWGDIDTHGLSILSAARGLIPRLRSLLMDEATLLRFRELWAVEPSQSPSLQASSLNPQEMDLFKALHANRWGQNVRLEQERIEWDYAQAALAALSCDAGPDQ